jgi:hypothetical protein
MRRHFVSHWRVWLIIAVLVILANELIDRNFFDHKEHLDGDLVLTLAVLLVCFLGSYLFIRSRSLRTRRTI